MPRCLFDVLVLVLVVVLVLLAVVPVAAAQSPAGDGGADFGAPVDDPFAPRPPVDAGQPSPDEEPDAAEAVIRDRVYVEDGTLIDGQLRGFRDGKLVVLSAIVGTILVPPENVVRYSLDRERIYYVKEDAARPSESIIVSVGSDGQLVYRPANQRTVKRLDFTAIEEMRDEPIPNEVWTVKAGVTGSIEVGNTDAINLGAEASVKRESKAELLNIEGQFSFAETNGAVSKRLFSGIATYRYFFSDEFGLFAEDDIRKDALAGLRLRNRINLGGTWRAANELEFKLSFDLGVNYTFESLTDDTDADFLGAVAKLAYAQDIAGFIHIEGDTRFNIDLFDPERWVLESRIEVRFSIDTTLAIGVRAEDTWTGRPAAGAGRNDLRMLVLFSFEFSSDDPL